MTGPGDRADEGYGAIPDRSPHRSSGRPVGSAGFTLAWILSVVPLGLEALVPGAPPFDGVSSFALVLLPWLALAGMPARRAGRATPEVWRTVGLLVGLSLPPLALGWGLDVANGRAAWSLAGGAGAALLGIASVLALGVARGLGRGGERAHRTQSWTWLAIVPGAATLALALGWAAGTGAPGLLGASPLVWCVRWLAAGSDPAGLGAAAPALAGCAVVLLSTAAAATLDARALEAEA